MLFLKNSRGNVSIIAQTKLRQLLKATYFYRTTEKYCSPISTSRRLGFSADTLYDRIWKITITTLYLEQEITFCWQCLTFQWPHSLSRKELFKNNKVFLEVIMEKKELWIVKHLRATGSYANNQNFQFPRLSKGSVKNRYRNKLQSDYEKCATGFFFSPRHFV